MARPTKKFRNRLVLILVVAGLGCLPSSNDSPSVAEKTSSVHPADVPAATLPTPAANGEKKPVDPVRHRIESALASVHRRDLLTTNSFWTIFHGILGMGPKTKLKDPVTGETLNALDYIFSEKGASIRGLIFTPSEVGLDVQTVGMNPFVKEHEGQGHQDQFLAEMIQWGVPANRPIKIASHPNKTFHLQDMVEESKARCRVDSNQELGWCLIVVAEYGGGTEAVWKNKEKQTIRFEDMLEYEIKADINMAACGGTHRLFGVAWAYHRHMAHCKKNNKQPTEVWTRAKAYLDKYKSLSKDWQSSDGVFSTAHYREREYQPELEPRLAASGHILEWLAQYVTDEEIREPWMEDAARAVAQIILDSDRLSVASGSLYHAAHGLATYHTRRYGSSTAETKIAGKK
jgi:hypothetical protein